MKLEKHLATLIGIFLFVAILSGCEKPEGPAEHAGKEIDKAADTAGQNLEKTGEAIQDAAKGKK